MILCNFFSLPPLSYIEIVLVKNDDSNCFMLLFSNYHHVEILLMGNLLEKELCSDGDGNRVSIHISKHKSTSALKLLAFQRFNIEHDNKSVSFEQ